MVFVVVLVLICFYQILWQQGFNHTLLGAPLSSMQTLYTHQLLCFCLFVLKSNFKILSEVAQKLKMFGCLNSSFENHLDL